MKKAILFILITILIKFKAESQNFPANGQAFIDTELPKIYITIDADSLNQILAPENRNSDYEYPATFNFVSSTLDTTIQNIGFRLRGNTSRASAKKSFKVSFNTFTQGAKFYGLEKMNLNGEHNDPSIIRSKLCRDFFRFMEVPGSRANHVELYINNQFKGLYINVEHIDEEFVENRFGSNNGNLYKCLWPADLNYKGTNPNDYKFGNNGERTYDLKTNVEQDDYSDLAEFINILNNTPLNEFQDKLEEIFDVNLYLKYLVVEILTGHWDAYSFNKNNYYLYKNTQTGKFEFIPYDPDNTFGIDWFGIDWDNRNIYSWDMAGEDRPLTERLLEHQVYRDRFSFYMKYALDNYFNSSNLNPKIDAFKTMIQTSAENDTYRTLDYGWTITDFNNSYNYGFTDLHVKNGLKDYISTRNNSANSQLTVNKIAPIVWKVNHKRPVANRNFEVFAYAEDEDTNTTIELFYSINGGNFTSVEMKDNGLGNDEIAGDKFYSVSIPAPLSSAGTIEYYIKATDSDNHSTREPFVKNFVAKLPEESEIQLLINEFMASNQIANADEFGEYDDWIEIYNAGNSAVWLGNKYLSDDILEPNKWQMPNINIQPNEFLLFWADKDQEQGDFHTNFKLSAAGEEIGVFDSFENDFAVIDFIEFTEQYGNISFGRTTDGGSEFAFDTSPTPGTSNIASSVSEIDFKSKIRVYPNPTSDKLIISSEEINFMKIQIFNTLGRLVYTENSFNQTQINLKSLNLNSGIYFIKMNFKYKNKDYTTANKIILK